MVLAIAGEQQLAGIGVEMELHAETLADSGPAATRSRACSGAGAPGFVCRGRAPPVKSRVSQGVVLPWFCAG
jgi:hypothetical protein